MQINQNPPNTSFGSANYAKSFKDVSPRVHNIFKINSKTIENISEGLNFKFDNQKSTMGLDRITLTISEERTLLEKLLKKEGFKDTYTLFPTKHFSLEKWLKTAKSDFLENLEKFNESCAKKALRKK